MVRQRVRIRFSKEGDLRFLGHRDLVRAMERLFRRAGLRLAMSQGFHPKPRMRFPSALALGVIGLDEVIDLELEECEAPERLLERLRRASVPGLHFHRVDRLASGDPKSRPRWFEYEIFVPQEWEEELRTRAARLMASQSCVVPRPRKETLIDVRPALGSLRIEAGKLSFRIRADQPQIVSPGEVFEALGARELLGDGRDVVRTGVLLDDDLEAAG